MRQNNFVNDNNYNQQHYLDPNGMMGGSGPGSLHQESSNPPTFGLSGNSFSNNTNNQQQPYPQQGNQNRSNNLTNSSFTQGGGGGGSNIYNNGIKFRPIGGNNSNLGSAS